MNKERGRNHFPVSNAMHSDGQGSGVEFSLILWKTARPGLCGMPGNGRSYRERHRINTSGPR